MTINNVETRATMQLAGLDFVLGLSLLQRLRLFVSLWLYPLSSSAF